MKYRGVQVDTTEVEIRTRSYTRFCKMHDWCTNEFGETGNYIDDAWTSREAVGFGYAMFYFENPKDAVWFKLNWQ